MTANVSKVREKIAALLAKTTQNGASEAEATAAMNHAAKLMRDFGVTLADIQNKTEAASDFVRNWVNRNDKNLNVFDKLIGNAIADYTDTKVWVDKGTLRVSKLIFFGYRVDVELAEYIREVCNQALEYEWKKFARLLPTGSRATARKSFQTGMALRLKDRLKALKAENTNQEAGRALVVVKKQLVEKAMTEMSMKMRKGGVVTYNSENSAFNAGTAAADKVRFNRDIQAGPTGGVKLIA